MRKPLLKIGATSSLDWDDVRHALAIARAGSLSRAADDLGVDHATLSRRAARIEKALAAKLFERSAAGMTLTAAGEALVRVAQEAEEKMLFIERQVRGEDSDGSHVRLVTSGTLAVSLLSGHLAEFTRRHPDIVLKLSISNGLPGAGGSDLALYVSPLEAIAASRVAPIVLGTVGWAAYVAVDAEAGARRAIQYSASRQPGRAWLDENIGAGAGAFADDVPSACVLAEGGCGVAVLPCFHADQRERLRQLSPVLEEHRLVVSVPSELAHVTRVRVFVEWLRRSAARDARRLAGRAPARTASLEARRRRADG